ncbi:unnamed protein product, partial [Prorocentrum cordatum]
VLGPRAPVHVRDPLAPAGRLRPAPDRHQRGARHRPGAPGRPAGGRRAADRLQRRRPRVPQPHVDDVRALGRVRGRRRAPRRTGLHLLVRRVREVRAAQVLRAAAARCRVTRRLRARARHLEARARLSRVRVSEAGDCRRLRPPPTGGGAVTRRPVRGPGRAGASLPWSCVGGRASTDALDHRALALRPSALREGGAPGTAPRGGCPRSCEAEGRPRRVPGRRASDLVQVPLGRAVWAPRRCLEPSG